MELPRCRRLTAARGCAVTIVLIAASAAAKPLNALEAITATLLQIGSAGDELGMEVAKGPVSLWTHVIDVSLVSEPQPYLVQRTEDHCKPITDGRHLRCMMCYGYAQIHLLRYYIHTRDHHLLRFSVDLLV